MLKNTVKNTTTMRSCCFSGYGKWFCYLTESISREFWLFTHQTNDTCREMKSVCWYFASLVSSVSVKAQVQLAMSRVQLVHPPVSHTFNYTTRRRDLEHLVTDVFCSVCVQWPERNYQKGVEHQSALIWTITVGFIYHQGKQATVGITEKALCVSRLSCNLFQNYATRNTGLKNQFLKKGRCEVCCQSLLVFRCSWSSLEFI